MKPLFTCLDDFPKPGTLIISFLYSPLPTSGKSNFSISSALFFVKLKPDPWGALIITKNAPLSSGAISCFGAWLKKKIVNIRVVIKNEKIIFFLLIQLVRDVL